MPHPCLTPRDWSASRRRFGAGNVTESSRDANCGTTRLSGMIPWEDLQASLISALDTMIRASMEGQGVGFPFIFTRTCGASRSPVFIPDSTSLNAGHRPQHRLTMTHCIKTIKTPQKYFGHRTHISEQSCCLWQTRCPSFPHHNKTTLRWMSQGALCIAKQKGHTSDGRHTTQRKRRHGGEQWQVCHRRSCIGRRGSCTCCAWRDLLEAAHRSRNNAKGPLSNNLRNDAKLSLFL